MQPIIQVGKSGIEKPLINTIENALEARELIKISILQNSLENPRELAEKISTLLRAETVQVIGRVIILYKKSSKIENRNISKLL